MKHVVSTADYEHSDILTMLVGAREYVEQFRSRERCTVSGTFVAPKVTLLFTEPSTRTAGSYAEACQLLGLRSERIEGEAATSLVKGESLSATARMLAGYNTDVLVVRSKFEGAARWLAEMLGRYGYRTAVHNAGDGSNQHPSQALLDLMTINDALEMDGLNLGLVGDLKNSRVCHSLVQALRGFPVRFTLVSSPEVALQPWYTKGLEVAVSDSLEALIGCHVVYVTRVQRERFANPFDYERVRGRFVVGSELLARLGSDVRIMHPQPVADGEVAPEIWGHPQVIMDQQAQFGVPARMCLLDQSLHCLDDTAAVDTPEPRVAIVDAGPIDERLQAKRARERYFVPIREGTVLDHLPVDAGPIVLKVLGIERDRREGVVVVSENLQTSKLPGGRKTTIVLEGRTLTQEQKAAVTFLAPSVTINEFRDGEARKVRIEGALALRGVGRCPNPSCITRNDVEAALSPVFHLVSAPTVACHYCEQHVERAALFAL